jgi:two-component system sensor histidine kinase PilS (NtrC family)
VTAAPATHYPESFWRSLRHLNGFRLYLAVFFVLSALFADQFSWLSRNNLGSFLIISLIYALSTWPVRRMLRERQPGFEQQLLGQLLLDILLLIVLMHLGGGRETGLALLLMVYMAAAGLHARTQVMLLIPAAATLALLGEQGLASLSGTAGVQGFVQAGLLAVGFFMVASLSHVLARGTLAAAELAGVKEQEAANLEKVNARVIQELPYGVVVVDAQDRVLQSNAQATLWMACQAAPHSDLRTCLPAPCRNSGGLETARSEPGYPNQDASGPPLSLPSDRTRCRAARRCGDHPGRPFRTGAGGAEAQTGGARATHR